MHKMKTTSSVASLIRSLAVAGIVVTFMATVAPMPLPAAAQSRRAQQVPYDKARRPLGDFFVCPVKNRMGEPMYFERRNTDEWAPATPFTVGPGKIVKQEYVGASSLLAEEFEGGEYTGRVTASWTYAGNTMEGVVLWDERWPEAPLCVRGAWPGCTLEFANKEVTLLAGISRRRLLGDLAVKECSKNWKGLGGWLPWGLGCTYPKHDHPYVGTIVS
jgi:hypothetical protein